MLTFGIKLFLPYGSEHGIAILTVLVRCMLTFNIQLVLSRGFEYDPDGELYRILHGGSELSSSSWLLHYQLS